MLDDFSKQKLLLGQDQIDITLEHQDLISKFSKDRKKLIPNLD
jgi:3-isopropylmalate dehydratase small subunit